MKKWIVWLKKTNPWLFLLIVPVLNFYLLEWYTHNPFQTMKPYIQGMNLALFEFAALFLFALTGRISRALGIETAFCAVYGLANYFVLEFRGAPIQPWDILSISTAASVADNYEYKLNRTAVIVLICFVLLLVLEFFLKKGFPKKNKKARIARVCLALSCGLLCFGYTKMLHSEDIVEQKLHLYNKLFTPTTIQFKNGTVTAFLMELQYISVDKPSGYSAENAKELLASYDNAKFINVKDDPLQVVKEIAECRYIISSSLHGLIVADSLGIPNMYLVFGDRLLGDGYKFEDYYSAYGVEAQPRDLRTEKAPELTEIEEQYQILPEMVEEKKRQMKAAFPYPVKNR